MTLETEADVYRELRRLLGRAPKAELWRHVVKHGWVQEVINAGYDECEQAEVLRTLFARYEEAADLAGDLVSDEAKPPRAPSAESPRSSPPTYALDALSEIMALEAQSHPLVVAFRGRVLGGACLPPDEVAGWLQDHEGHLWLGEPWPPAWAHQMVSEKRIERLALDARELPENDVEAMISVIDVLKDTYGWPDPLEVAGFVLCGETPALPPGVAYVRMYDRFFPKTARVCLEVSPQMEPQELMRLYASLRYTGMAKGARIRPPDGAMSRLAVFAARHNDGRTWQDAFKEWKKAKGWRDDETQKHRQYDDERSFTRDARKAYRMVTGQDLEWRGGVSAQPREEK